MERNGKVRGSQSGHLSPYSVNWWSDRIIGSLHTNFNFSSPGKDHSFKMCTQKVPRPPTPTFKKDYLVTNQNVPS